MRAAGLVAGSACAPESWTRAGHLFREKYSENTRAGNRLVAIGVFLAARASVRRIWGQSKILFGFGVAPDVEVS